MNLYIRIGILGQFGSFFPSVWELSELVSARDALICIRENFTRFLWKGFCGQGCRRAPRIWPPNAYFPFDKHLDCFTTIEFSLSPKEQPFQSNTQLEQQTVGFCGRLFLILNSLKQNNSFFKFLIFFIQIIHFFSNLFFLAAIENSFWMSAKYTALWEQKPSLLCLQPSRGFRQVNKSVLNTLGWKL